MKQGEKTKRLILQEANRLFYTKGYANTSFADIVDVTGLSKGNITYHFKTKQSILEAIVAKRVETIEAQIAAWEQKSDDPKELLLQFCDMIVQNIDDIKAYGCPMGTLVSEFAKNEPQLHSISLKLFEVYVRWLTKQYEALRIDDAHHRALSLLAKVQGVALICHIFQHESFLLKEIKEIKDSIKAL